MEIVICSYHKQQLKEEMPHSPVVPLENSGHIYDIIFHFACVVNL